MPKVSIEKQKEKLLKKKNSRWDSFDNNVITKQNADLLSKSKYSTPASLLGLGTNDIYKFFRKILSQNSTRL